MAREIKFRGINTDFPTETDKSEAVDFTEWIRLLSPKIYKHVGGEKPHYYNGKYYTTQELYSIYKQSKTK